VSERGWQREFEDPISLPDGRKLVTLRDAADYITALSKTEAALPEWQAAIEAFDGRSPAARPNDVRAYRCHEDAEPRLRRRVISA
jgi:hypothetical protein